MYDYTNLNQCQLKGFVEKLQLLYKLNSFIYFPFSVNRAVRIFITYAYDSKSHMRQVVSLAKCLKDNNFAVSLDMLELNLIAADKTGWLDTRFKNVCPCDEYTFE